jgi:hypothetical protein
MILAVFVQEISEFRKKSEKPEEKEEVEGNGQPTTL